MLQNTRADYVSPRITVLGGVRELTLGLSGNKHEPHGRLRLKPKP